MSKNKCPRGKLKVVKFTLCEPSAQYIKNPDNAYQLVRDDFSGISEEMHALIICNIKNVVLKTLIAKGSYNKIMVKPADIFRPVLIAGGNSFLLLHNHPSDGVPEPSEEDIQFTSKINKASTIVGLTMLDHIIFTNDKYYSFKKEGLL